jgi:hypothetical protein
VIRWLKLIFFGVLVGMLVVTIRASLDRSVFDAGEVVRDPWGLATLVDAYFGFLTFYLWVAYKERTALRRSLWFVLIMALGNIAMAIYMLIQLYRLPEGAGIERLLLRKESATAS